VPVIKKVIAVRQQLVIGRRVGRDGGVVAGAKEKGEKVLERD